MFKLGQIKSTAEGFLNGYKADNPATYAAALQAVGGVLILDGFVGIESPFGKQKRPGIFGSIVGIAFGLVFVFSFSFIGSLAGFNTMTAITDATVVSVSSNDNTCTPRASYVVDSKEYTQTAQGGSSTACGLTEGQIIKINYDPNSPGSWSYDLGTTKKFMLLFPIAGVLIAISSFFTFIVRLLCIIFGWKLLKHGRALAKTLPPGTDLSTIKNEIKQNFAKNLFGFGAGNITTPQV